MEDLRAALLQSQFRHPILRAAIRTNGNGKPRFVSSDAPIPLRVVQRANSAKWLDEVEVELALPFKPDDQTLMRVSLIQGEAVSELILVVHHSIGDGVSAKLLVRDLLESMEGHRLEALPARNAIEDLLGAADPGSTKPPRRPPQSGVATGLDRPRRESLQIFDIGPGELERILNRTRKEGATLHGALLASLLLSLAPRQTLQCLSPISVRELIPDGADDFGLFIAAGIATLNSDSPMDFWSLARAARGQLMQGINPNALSARFAGISAAVAGNLSPQAAYEMWRSGGYNAVLTNLGRLPDMPRLKRFRVTASYPILSPESVPVVAVATVAGRACFTFSSPPAMAGVSSRFLELLRQQTS